MKTTIPSTRGNNRGIDHIFASREILRFISRAGLVPEKVCFASDHIGLFMDISPRVLDTTNAPIPPAPARKLKMHNIPNVRKYVKAVVKQIKCHNIVTRLKTLGKQIKDEGFDTMVIIELEKIDKHMTQIMLKAGNDLAPSDTKYTFSEDLLLQMRKVRLIKTFIRQQENNYPLESFVDAAMEDEALQLINFTPAELETSRIDARDLLIQMQDE